MTDESTRTFLSRFFNLGLLWPQTLNFRSNKYLTAKRVLYILLLFNVLITLLLLIVESTISGNSADLSETDRKSQLFIIGMSCLISLLWSSLAVFFVRHERSKVLATIFFGQIIGTLLIGLVSNDEKPVSLWKLMIADVLLGVSVLIFSIATAISNTLRPQIINRPATSITSVSQMLARQSQPDQLAVTPNHA